MQNRMGAQGKLLLAAGVTLAVVVIMLTVLKPSGGVTVAVASRELALMLADTEVIQSAEGSRFPAGDRENWYVPYMDYLYSKGLLDETLTTADKASAARELTVDELKRMADGFGFWQNSEVWRKNHVSRETWTSFLTEVMSRISGGNVETKGLSVYATAANVSGVEAWHVVTELGEYTFGGFSMDAYLDCSVQAWVRGTEIIRVLEVTDREVSYENALVTGTEGDSLTVYYQGYRRVFALPEEVSLYQNMIIDLNLNNGEVRGIRRKRDVIDSRIIAIGDDGAELEGYGFIPFSSEIGVYQTYGNVAMRSPSDIVIGYDTYETVVAEGEICAILIRQSPDAKTIRVLLTEGSGAVSCHPSVSVTAESDFTVTVGRETFVFRAGETVRIDADGICREEFPVEERDSSPAEEESGEGSAEGKDRTGSAEGEDRTGSDAGDRSGSGEMIFTGVTEGQRITIEADCGELTVLSLTRSFGNPTYPGALELLYQDGGFYLINETQLEDYLCYVVPAEMPADYHMEALRAQAICARGFAVNHLTSGRYKTIGAHVDDTVNYQVYNYSGATERTTQAVRDTYGEVLTLNDEIVTTFYYSTSCGYTSDISLWGEDPVKSPYLMAKRMAGSGEIEDIQNEEVFREFIKDTALNDYENSYGWYRWKFSVTLDELTVIVNTRLANLSAALKSRVLTRQQDGSWKEGASTVGKVQSVTVTERGPGGIAAAVEIVGSEATVRLMLQSAIREVLGSAGYVYQRIDGSTVTGRSSLASAYFCLDGVYTDGSLSGYTVYGGGSGHGVGMSQNCANALGKSGVDAETMLKFFYEGTTVSQLYR